MLGWFKKKFGKKKDTPSSTEIIIDEIPSAEIAQEQDSSRVQEKTGVQDVQPTQTIESPESDDKDIDVPKTIEKDISPDTDTSPVEPQDSEIPTETFASSREPAPVVGTENVEKNEKIQAEVSQLERVEPPEDVPEVQDPVVEPEEIEPPATKKKSLFSRLSDRLGKTKESLTYQMDALFLGKKEIDEDMLDDLEEILITADIGVGTTQELIDNARLKIHRKELSDPDGLKKLIKEQIKTFIVENEEDAALVMPKKGPFVIMAIGVNGVGKTTTIGKIAHKFQKVGNSVMLVAADTFRAAAVSQLKIWGERNGVEVVAHKDGADPSSVIFDALEIAQAKEIDVVLVDTAGRMHTKENLMEELKKIKRVMNKKLPGAPHEILLVIDATTGQNGISQARLFDDAVNVTGLALTKLDGTSKGGIVANICKEMKIPIRFIGIGEQMDDLRDFDANDFVEALFD
jgi:fused signal recognition particle receptor